MKFNNIFKIIKEFFALIICLFFIGSLDAKDNFNYLIQPGDLIKITVLGEDDLFRELRVSVKGTITYPLLGEINVKGKTSEDLESHLTVLLSEYLVSPHVSVFISEFGKVFVYGEVEKPGAFELSGNISILESITLAGGFTKYANPKKVRIIRKAADDQDKQIILVDLSSIAQKGDKTKDIDLIPGDVVFVPESFL